MPLRVGNGNACARPICYVTDRSFNPQAEAIEKQYSGMPSKGRAVSYGTCVVNVPDRPAYKSKGLWTIDSHDRHSGIEFLQILRAGLSEFEHRRILIFIHGFRVSFEEALHSTALLADELRFEGIPICYSWPSAGNMGGYLKDETQIAETHHQLIDLLAALENLGNVTVDVVAHSMGNRALTSAVHNIVRYKIHNLRTVNQIFLVAPDVERHSCAENWQAIRAAKVGVRATCYYSDRDIPLIASAALHRDSRAGSADWQSSSVDLIDVSRLGSIWRLNHAPHIHVPRVLGDMFVVATTNKAPDKRVGLYPIGKHHYMRPG